MTFIQCENPFKGYYKAFFVFLIVMFTSLLLVNAAEFDNIKTYEKDIGDFGKITIRNSILGIPFFQLDKVIELELKVNSDICVGFDCHAEKEIILYEDGILISDIRFRYSEKDGTQSYNTLNYRLSIRTDEEITVDDFARQCVKGKFIEGTNQRIFDEENQTFIDINNEGYFEKICNVVKVGSHQEIVWDTYKLGEEIEAGTYYVRLDGELPSLFSVVDWQIKTNGYWLEEWLEWTSGLNTNLEAYWNMTNTTATTITDLTGHGYDIELNNSGGISEVEGRLNRAQYGDNWTSLNYGNISNQGMVDFNRNISFAAWINLTIDISSPPIISLGGTNGMDFGFSFGNLTVLKRGVSVDVVDDRIINDSQWHHVAAIIELDGNIILYVDGTNNVNGTAADYDGTQHSTIGESIRAAGGTFFNGYIDELGVWNRSLTNAEVLQLYNNGVGIEFNVNASITLNTPANDSNLLTGDQLFNATFEVPTEANITNSTLYIWNSTNLVNFTTNLTVETVDLNNNTYIFTVNLPSDLDNYTWNVFGCSNESLPNPCNWASDNRTFETLNFVENSQTFNNQTLEGSIETFTLNITYDSSRFTNANANLFYNDTSHTSTRTGIGDEAIFTTDITIPLIGPEVNVSFNWLVELESITESFSGNSTSNNQTIQNVTIDDCTIQGVEILNFTLRDEVTQDLLDGNLTNSTVEIDLQIYSVGDRSNTVLNFSQNYSENNNPRVCINDLNTTYEMDVRVFYDADDYVPEFYNIQNFTLSNSTAPSNISLFDLLDIDATQFLITFKDQNFIPVQDALIEIQRQYIAEGVFKAIEIPITDEEGSATGHFQLAGAVYTIVVTKQGTILATFNDVSIYCDDRVIEDCRINLNALSSGVPFIDWTEVGGITFTESFDRNTRTITTIFTSTDGTPKTVLLNATRFDRFFNESVCSNTLTTASGTLQCIIPESFENITVVSELSVAGNIISTSSYTISLTANEVFGSNATILLLIMMLILPMMLISSTIGVIIGIIIGLVLGALFTLYNLDSVIGPVSSLLWIIIAGGILIWKIISRRE